MGGVKPKLVKITGMLYVDPDRVMFLDTDWGDATDGGTQIGIEGWPTAMCVDKPLDDVAAIINAHRERVTRNVQLAMDLLAGKKPDKGDDE